MIFSHWAPDSCGMFVALWLKIAGLASGSQEAVVSFLLEPGPFSVTRVKINQTK